MKLFPRSSWHILSVLILLSVSLPTRATLSVKSVNGTCFSLFWTEENNVTAFELTVIRPTTTTYHFNTAEEPSLEEYDFTYSNVRFISRDDEGLVRVLRLGDDYENGYIALPQVSTTGTYRLTVTASAISAEELSNRIQLMEKEFDKVINS